MCRLDAGGWMHFCLHGCANEKGCGELYAAGGAVCIGCGTARPNGSQMAGQAYQNDVDEVKLGCVLGLIQGCICLELVHEIWLDALSWMPPHCGCWIGCASGCMDASSWISPSCQPPSSAAWFNPFVKLRQVKGFGVSEPPCIYMVICRVSSSHLRR